MIPDLTSLTAATGSWMIIALKAVAATGFMAAADVVILYAC
jgi:hypothetical protein